MNHRNLLTWGLIVLAFVALGSMTGLSPTSAAQSDGEAWTSSEEPPPGTTLEQLSVPDVPSPASLQPDVSAPEGLISWRVTGSALKPRENDVSYTVNSSGSCTYVTAGDASTVWNIPVMLPQGTTVDTLRIYYYDTSGSNSTAWFSVYDLYGAIVDEWSVSTSGDAGNSFNDSALIDHTVDYSVYSYMLNWRPVVSGASLQLCGFRIFHDPPIFGLNFLPLVTSDSP